MRKGHCENGFDCNEEIEGTCLCDCSRCEAEKEGEFGDEDDDEE